MPFFLVTHTSLVEAKDEQEAAEKAATDIRNGHEITVMVKADEFTVRQITVAAQPSKICPSETGSSSCAEPTTASSVLPLRDFGRGSQSDEHNTATISSGETSSHIIVFAILAVLLALVFAGGGFLS